MSERTECGKRRYGSKRQAREAHRHAHWRVRAYQCSLCHGAWHVSNTEKVEVSANKRGWDKRDR